MPNPAITDDIEARWRPLSDPEIVLAETRLADAWRKLQRDVPGLEARFATEADLEDEAVKVLADSVIRLLRGAEPRKGSVGIDDRTRSWEYDETYSSSELFFTDDELEGLRPAPRGRARVFSVMPS